MGFFDMLRRKAQDPEMQAKAKQAAQKAAPAVQRAVQRRSAGGGGPAPRMGGMAGAGMGDVGGVPGDYDGDGVPDAAEYGDQAYGDSQQAYDDASSGDFSQAADDIEQGSGDVGDALADVADDPSGYDAPDPGGDYGGGDYGGGGDSGGGGF